MVAASVVICTYNRPEGLKLAVRTARSQQLRDGFSAEIWVVDNSADANARETVASLAAEPGLPLHYLSVPRPNVSLARNAGVIGSSGDYVVFVDDDEWCVPGWLDAMIDTAERTGADVVFGAVLAEYPDGLPSWDPTGRSLERRMSLPTGSTIGLRHDPKISGLWIGTGNSLLRRATCFEGNDAPFDPALGGTGGEDYDLFLRLSQIGRRFVWCAEGIVWEPVPGTRLTPAYRFGRAFITGQMFAAITIRRAAHPWRAAALIAVKGVVQLGLVMLQWSLARLRGQAVSEALDHKLRMVGGKLLWWKLGLWRT